MEEFTVAKLRQYDGNGPTGRIYIAVKRNVYDVTEKGKTFYGPDGPYAKFAGRDASLGLATMRMEMKDTGKPDDLSNLRPIQKLSLDSWEKTYQEKYTKVGILVE